MMKSNRIIFFNLLIALAAITCCRPYAAFEKSTVVPAADATLKVSYADSDNYDIKIKVENLAQPHELTPAKSNYVVWIESQYGTYNIGKLPVDKKLKATLFATTPYKPTRVVITAEDNANATEPGNQVVLTSKEISVK